MAGWTMNQLLDWLRYLAPTLRLVGWGLLLLAAVVACGLAVSLADFLMGGW